MPLSLIPQLFYDLIARVLPGLIIMIFGFIVYTKPSEISKILFNTTSENNSLSFATLIILFLVSYILGFIIPAFWSKTFKLLQQNQLERTSNKAIKHCIENHNKLRKLIQKPTINISANDIPPLYVLHDHLRILSSSEAYRLLKLQAEKRLCQVLVFGFSILLVLNSIEWFQVRTIFAIDRIILELFFVGSIYSLWKRNLRLEEYFTNGVCNAWLLFNFSIDKAKDKDK